jgi:endonuclease-3
MTRRKEMTTVDRIIRTLKEEYPDAKTALVFSNPLELLVATVLSAQCTDERVNAVTRELFKKYKKAQDYARADLKELEEDVRPTGFYRNKAKAIKTLMIWSVSPVWGERPLIWYWERPLAFPASWWTPMY